MGLLSCVSRAAALEASVLAQFASIGIPKSRVEDRAGGWLHLAKIIQNVWPTDSSSGALCGEPAGSEALEFFGGLWFRFWPVCRLCIVQCLRHSIVRYL